MDLKTKLHRLPAIDNPPAEVSRLEPPVQSRALGELRAKLDQLLAKHAPPSQPSNGNTSSRPLPMERFEYRDGYLLRRLQRWPSSELSERHWVGMARQAASELLSLLALDPSLFRLDPGSALYLDTETTGLGGGAGVLAFLVGVAWFEGDHLALEQWLLEDPAQEGAMLSVLEERLARASMLVTFNGKSFDWPLLAGRYVMNRRPVPSLPPHLDLLHVARRLHRARIGSVNLRRVEREVLGFDRGPDLSGADIAPRYWHFLRTGEGQCLSEVVDHNATDVLSMVAMVGLYGEPLDHLCDVDLIALGRTLARAGALDEAMDAAELALGRTGAAAARRAAADIAKARGDRGRALCEFELLASELDDPEVRLELVKLYEHYVKRPALALQVLAKGTGEPPELAEKRRRRLEARQRRQDASTGSGKSSRDRAPSRG